uniref:Uncharacterized protein n=1 Tax=Arundo donax TaxID=35708 RepID=A0A0A9AKP2_ARUDO
MTRSSPALFEEKTGLSETGHLPEISQTTLPSEFDKGISGTNMHFF